ncbi:TIGR02117 family protein [Ferrovibrio sp.]|uniref:TIGR02117 family protein n=1 Tax=Ferrovibrio sp. TaxID=1917215 RepID=UPI000CAA994E|nr:TIGR02117 family protein [Ferrovibrio sp.]PJI39081.1 MAG: TIGR02117 family protein [Ferrovibrio sp.]
MRSLRRLLPILCLPVLALPVLYGAAALALGLLPAPHRQPMLGQPTVPVYLMSNGWHVWVALPARADKEGTDWGAWLAESSLGERLTEGDYVAFGWGDRDFYLNTRRPVDFRPGLALAALLGRGPAAMHVMRVPEAALTGSEPKPRRLEVDTLQYRALTAYIWAGFARGGDGRPQPLPEPGFGLDDAFFEATGRYSPFRTCNEWIGAGLRAAGLKTGWWTPFPYGLMQGG